MDRKSPVYTRKAATKMDLRTVLEKAKYEGWHSGKQFKKLNLS
jgi:hypothetical protein